MKKFFEKVKNYIIDAYNELVYKVSWPSRPELTSSAVIVMSASLIMALVIFVVDSAFEYVVKFLYGIL
jgi:preprotein translocase subunit SecE